MNNVQKTLRAKEATLGSWYRLCIGNTWDICMCKAKQAGITMFSPIGKDVDISIDPESIIEHISIDPATGMYAADAMPGQLYYFGQRIIKIKNFTEHERLVSGSVPFIDMKTNIEDRIDVKAEIYPCSGLSDLPPAKVSEKPNYITRIQELLKEALGGN